MPLPPSPLLIAGWRTTTPFTRIPGWATAHPANTSCCLNPPPVRFNGVNSSRTAPLRKMGVSGQLHMKHFSVRQKWVARDAIFGTFFGEVTEVADDGKSGIVVIT